MRAKLQVDRECVESILAHHGRVWPTDNLGDPWPTLSPPELFWQFAEAVFRYEKSSHTESAGILIAVLTVDESLFRELAAAFGQRLFKRLERPGRSATAVSPASQPVVQYAIGPHVV